MRQRRRVYHQPCDEEDTDSSSISDMSCSGEEEDIDSDVDEL